MIMMIIMRRGRKTFAIREQTLSRSLLSALRSDCLENWSHTVKMNDNFWLLWCIYYICVFQLNAAKHSIICWFHWHTRWKQIIKYHWMLLAWCECNCDYNRNWLQNNISMVYFPMHFLLNRCEIIKNAEALTCQMSTFDGLESSNWMEIAIRTN